MWRIEMLLRWALRVVVGDALGRRAYANAIREEIAYLLTRAGRRS